MTEIIIDIFEQDEFGKWQKVLRHTFYGKNKKEAEGILRAHKTTDSFLRAALDQGQFKNIPLKVESFIKQ